MHAPQCVYIKIPPKEAYHLSGASDSGRTAAAAVFIMTIIQGSARETLGTNYCLQCSGGGGVIGIAVTHQGPDGGPTSVVVVPQTACLCATASLADRCCFCCCRSMPAEGRQGLQDTAARRRRGRRTAQRSAQWYAWRLIMSLIHCCVRMSVVAPKVLVIFERSRNANHSAVH